MTWSASGAGAQTPSVSVVIPALNEEATVAGVVEAALASSAAEVLVIDSDSTDATAGNAARAGARVLNWRDIAPEIPVHPGKGESLWRGVKAASGDIVVFLDADVTSIEPGWVDKLAAPFADPGIHLVKAAYSRAIDGAPTGGGRVTELTAKPLLRIFYPEVSHIDQPLAGEYAIRRDTALKVPFVGGYGVEAGLLVDVVKQYGADAVAQAHLGRKAHRNRPLTELSAMAETVARTILARANGLEIDERVAWVG